MADSSVTWDLIARDRASSTVNRVGGSVETLTRRVTRLAGAFGGAFALERLGEFALKSADALERSRSRLETITSNIGGDFAAEAGHVQALDDRLAAFGFTNADVEGSVASLETATKSLPKALRDVALAADIARGRNISLEEATRILQRVETGHVSQLARLGIQVKDVNGHILSQRAALEQLARTYQGNASHFADTFAGKQQALRAELGNSAAEIGTALLPAAVDLAHVLQDDILPTIERTAKFFDRNRRVLEPLVGLVIKLGLAWKAYKFFAGAALEVGAAHAATKAAEGATEKGALTAFSMARPLPVFVVNQRGGGGPGGVVGKTESAAETAGAEGGALAGAKRFIGRLGPRAFRGGIIYIAGDTAVSFLPEGEGKTLLSRAVTGGAAGFALGGPVGAAVGAAGLPAAQAAKDYATSVDAAPGNLQNQYARMAQTAEGRAKLQADLAKLQQIAARDSQKTAANPQGIVPQTIRDETRWIQAALQGTNATKHQNSELRETARDSTTAARSIRGMARELHSAQTRSIALSGSQDALREAIHNMAIVVGQGNRNLVGNSDAALANRDALRGAVQSAENYIQTLRDQHVARAKVRAIELQTAEALLRGATATYKNRDAVVAMLRQLHFLPSQIKKALGSTYTVGYNAMVDVANGFVDAGYQAATAVGLASASLNKQLRLGLGADQGGGQQANFVEKPLRLKYKAAGVELGGDFTDGYSKVVKDKVPDAAKEAAKKAAEAARRQMQQDFQTIKQFFTAEKASLISTFSPIDLSPQTDSLGASGPAKSILSQLRMDARQADVFTRLYLRLERANLNPRLLEMFQGLGTEAIPTMRLWLQHPRMIRQANRAEVRITGDANKIAVRDTEDKYGPLIHRDLQHLPRKFANELEAKLRRIHIDVSVQSVSRKQGHRVNAL